MAFIGKRKRQDKYFEDGVFTDSHLNFGTIASPGGIRAEGEFSDGGHLVVGRLFLPDFVASGKYHGGQLVSGSRFFYAPRVLDAGQFKNNFLVAGIHLDERVTAQGKFDHAGELDHGEKIFANGTVAAGKFSSGTLRDGTMVRGNEVSHGWWNLSEQLSTGFRYRGDQIEYGQFSGDSFSSGVRVYRSGKFERGKFCDGVLVDGVVVEDDFEVRAISPDQPLKRCKKV